MLDKIIRFWQGVRTLSGDDAYERYLKHYAELQRTDAGHVCAPPLSKADFFKQWQDEKWNGIRRCC